MISQLIANAVIAAAIYALVGVGFAMIYWSAHFFNFAHAVSYTLGAYITFALMTALRLPLPVAAVMAIVGSAGFGVLMELAVYKRMRRKGASSLGLLLASLGLMVAAQNVVSLTFGDDVKSIRSGVISSGLPIGDARVTAIQIWTVGSAIVLLTLLWLAMHHTKTGRSLRAVANEPELAEIVGIDSDRMILWTFAIGSAVAGAAGILVALDTDLNPTMGLRVLLMSVTAVIVGGEGRIHGVAIGALLVGATQHLGVLRLDTQWQDAIVFALLIVFLIVRPQGVFGRPQRKVSV
jgi:branched-chain amino acid transport system permease protein